MLVPIRNRSPGKGRYFPQRLHSTLDAFNIELGGEGSGDAALGRFGPRVVYFPNIGIRATFRLPHVSAMALTSQRANEPNGSNNNGSNNKGSNNHNNDNNSNNNKHTQPTK
jgi:hypothetical protein